jgi:membrane-bound lytic murein transglycosylase D
MKIPWTIVAVLAFNSLVASTHMLLPTSNEDMSRRWTASMDSDVKERLAQLDLPFEAKYEDRIRDLIKDYTIYGYRNTEMMLGRTQHYFPIFEHYLSQYDVPTSLKYLPIVETGLAAKSYSGAGAAGLWQFIPSSARLYKLKMDRYVDNRLDTYRSTEAAAQMLANLYKQYKSWPLVLAAYNCGPVRVNQAIKAAGCRNFWELRAFLPQETQDYIPRYIAAAYIANYYTDHGIEVRYKKDWPTQALTLKVYDEVSLGQLSFASKVSLDILQMLNPTYRANLIPASKEGNYLIVPAHAVEPIKDYLRALKGGQWINPILLHPNAHRVNYVVKPGETMEQIADNFDCTIKQITEWNQLKKAEAHVNQPLILFLSDSGYIKP